MYSHLYSGVGITTVFNALHPGREILSLGNSLVFCFNCYMSSLNCYVLAKRMTKNLLNKAKTVICMGQLVAWRSLLLLGVLFKVISVIIPLDPKPSGR